MSEVTPGTIESKPNARGEHDLACPKCFHSFLSTISKNDKTGKLKDVTCSACGHKDDPKHFIAAAHSHEIKKMSTDYVQSELNKALGGKNINIDFHL